MMLKDLLGKRKYATVSKVNLERRLDDIEKPNIPTGMWSKCTECSSIVYTEDLSNNMNVCPKCGYHMKISAMERIKYIFDKDTFKQIDSEVVGKNPLEFEGYEEKLAKAREATSLKEAVVTGYGTVGGNPVVTAIMDSNFMMGSMGTAVGEKITRAIEYATSKRLPIIIFTTSGGARMQEGIFSLMQMAKVSGAVAKHGDTGLLYITVITHPTTGGVTASFAMEGDIIISEPKALIGFAGRRVIESTINEKLPENFQSAEFLFQKGFIDKIVDRRNMKTVLSKILTLHEVRK
ncbi:acetyl-CoA carboxylase, carboxyl transferase, beta subunit [Clostridium cellulovorans 743B]|uniref:Acetyl-coenzyme A carboxylase carboxyl transferase subunit beta n=2 Tax=Clostridium cellulovorans TaxID=1493 RepID=D9SME0_CLOC7|nr:acetyl-CoA carboxylase, carboxyl transferase, beta subunit [Clostridium cellulovorans 743B]